MGRRKSRSRSRRKQPRDERKSEKRVAPRHPSPEPSSDSGSAPAWASSSPSPTPAKRSRGSSAAVAATERKEQEEEMPAEARIALLEVENETLKAENRELRKKLVEALRRRPSAASAPDATAGRRGEAATERHRDPPADASPPRRVRREMSPPAKQVTAEEPPRKRAAKEPSGADMTEVHGEPSDKNAVLLANDAMEVYNESITNNVAPEKRLPLVNAKLDRFRQNFSSNIQIIDLRSGGIIIKDLKAFNMRYGCVFRESGAKLKGTCHKRFYYDAVHRPTFVLDFEMHESLVTATPGTPHDGKLGVREPRTEHLVVLYEETGGKISRMWMRQDAEKLGIDPAAGEDALLRTETVKAFEAKIVELRGGPAAPRIFQNYHHIPTVG
eukprot:TRINITY_DN42974_c0_g1_i1.p1 TRINITY_DN42974_c0_g1~~TRINITY_DN42974_c0_g1_i1.p1  ORF type:complete len:385 (-),score=77.25 TRINITY_DN42974_c0_g1_i1:111-1265(-)